MFSISIQRFQRTNTIIGLVYALERIASLDVNQDRLERAVQLFAWARAMRDKIGDRRPPVEQASVEKDVGVARSKLDEADFAKLSTEGRTMTIGQAILMSLKE